MNNPSEVDSDVLIDLLGEPAEEIVDDIVEPQEEEIPSETEPVESQEEESTDSVSDYMSEFLSTYGVENGIITYENEDGTTEDISFNDLDDAEKLNILRELTTPNLSENEIATVNYLRRNNATLQDVIEYYSNQAVENYIKNNENRQYSIDSYTDDEVYIADLKAKYSDMTDEELQADLESAKMNEALFKKKVDSIRTQYKTQEENSEKEALRKQEEDYNAYKDTIYNVLNSFNDVSMDYKDASADSLQIENSEKDAIYNYILRRDENGLTQFVKDINDPKRFVEIAWYALYGKDAISDITNYWKSQLKSSRKADTRVQPKSQTTVVKKDIKPKDTFPHLHNTITFAGGEDLL